MSNLACNTFLKKRQSQNILNSKADFNSFDLVFVCDTKNNIMCHHITIIQIKIVLSRPYFETFIVVLFPNMHLYYFSDFA